jgi:hypothetical protein
MSILRVIIEDECLAAWMTINNTFTAKGQSHWDAQTQLWDGVMIQLGQYVLVPQHQGNKPVCELHSVQFKASDNIVREILADEFQKRAIWINVVAGQAPDLLDPMLPQHLESIFPDPVPAGEKLHVSLKPTRGGITIWQLRGRAKGFDLAARQVSNMFLHNRFTFEFDIGLKSRVEIHGLEEESRKRQTADQRRPILHEGIDEIVIKPEVVSPGHGDGRNPPQRP